MMISYVNKLKGLLSRNKYLNETHCNIYVINELYIMFDGVCIIWYTVCKLWSMGYTPSVTSYGTKANQKLCSVQPEQIEV